MLLFDIGANVGKWTLQNLDTNTIIAVEASPTTYQRLVKNVTGKDSIIALNYAVTSSPETNVTFYESKSDALSTLDKRWLEDPRSRFGVNSPYNGYSPYKKILVKSITLDALIAQYGVPDLLKVDVEGAENIAIRSLTQRARLLCFEWASEWNKETYECVDHLASIGYTRFHIQVEDSYDYRPSQFEHNKNSVKLALSGTKAMIDWGMIWCFF
jgi:FkbM family methyltransferase